MRRHTARAVVQVVAVAALATACGPGGAPRAAGTSAEPVPPTGAFPEGTYTALATKRDALRLDQKDACALHHGGLRQKLVFTDGAWTEWQSCAVRPEQTGSKGTYESTGDRLTLTERCCGTTTLSWTFDGKTLTLRTLGTGSGEPVPADFRFIWERRWTKAS